VRKLLALLTLTLLWDASGWDAVVSAGFGSASGFAARDALWAQTLLHDGLRGFNLALIGVALGLLLLLPPRTGGLGPGPTRARQLQALLALLAAALLVPALRRYSLTSCPWSLAEFGGTVPWVSHWAWGLTDGGPGHCFPSGHAAGSFAFFAQLWLWAPHRRERPVPWRFWCAVVLLGGVAGSVAQVARGAHFVSHCLWSACLCAALTALLMLRPRRAVRPERPSPVPA
jgi:membrane-associated PAP2 superfamily phosphatase